MKQLIVKVAGLDENYGVGAIGYEEYSQDPAGEAFYTAEIEKDNERWAVLSLNLTYVNNNELLLAINNAVFRTLKALKVEDIYKVSDEISSTVLSTYAVQSVTNVFEDFSLIFALKTETTVEVLGLTVEKRN